ncbi:molybdate ABC transporter substrate-binding protein [Rhodothalassium salexigens]|uniref:molybdate ABC transporter substrate-binding protein n=1 Tax=Rhodothalassium salexigens TaxID=1086 RepID=UPI00191365A9|nr:molybdate ABC transporter substrate-binding protein [Rhodothalassium salexigens]MBK5910800.1 molybdate ABC transporter substrate-binding protein [Rhodothalassium salexigens]MBK5920546.1 molybdate ABC transporter substrate-binding protein [Rhodothalassium salexigens]
MRTWLLGFLVGVGVLWEAAAVPGRAAETATVAVAANFARPSAALVEAFSRRCEGRLALRVVRGSTGGLYAQIRYGAPYHLFLAADADRPARLVAEGHALAGSRFTYAVGRLALWQPAPGGATVDGPAVLRARSFRRLAVANPDLAPYGAAAMAVLARLDLTEALASRLVRAENVGQAFALTATGNADWGFVGLASVLARPNGVRGRWWAVPPGFHPPVRQDAVLLSGGRDNRAAEAFLVFLQSDEAAALIGDFGYGVPAR